MPVLTSAINDLDIGGFGEFD